MSSEALEQQLRQRSVLFRAGSCLVACTEPVARDSAAGRYLQLHPDGIGAVVFDVDDVERAFYLTRARRGTPVRGIERVSDATGLVAGFAIASPLDDVEFQFIERHGDRTLPLPGFVATPRPAAPRPDNPAFHSYDHLTFNFQTMAPAAMWLEHVLGFQPFWRTAFHTGDQRNGAGSGLRSAVLWDERSNIKFALNEPLVPNFQASQIYRFCEDQRGSGVQHVALAVDDIVHAVRVLRRRGARFMATPDAYYRRLPDRLAALGLRGVEEPLSVLQDLGILIDGERDIGYLLQIFMDPAQAAWQAAGSQGVPSSPFFFELIQRKGDRRFGEGNFRALFESIEHAQTGAAALAGEV